MLKNVAKKKGENPEHFPKNFSAKKKKQIPLLARAS